MKLQTRFLGAILALSLLPLLAQGIIFYTAYRKDLSLAVHSQLISVAATQQSRMVAILHQNQERLALIASRTQLRLSLDRYNTTGIPSDRERMDRILVDAAASIAELVGIEVYDPQGTVVASTDPEMVGKSHFDRIFFEKCRSGPVVDHLYLDDEGAPRVHLSGPMFLDGRFIGVILVRSGVDNLLASIFDYSGLGESGETILTRPDGENGHRFLAPTRLDPLAAMNSMDWDICRLTMDDPGKAGSLPSSCIDYRGVPVLAVSRTVPHTDWTLTVKIDRAEAFAGLQRTARGILVLAGILAFGVVLLAQRFSRHLTRPLRELAEAAEGIAGGRYDQRVRVTSRDELGTLESAFNAMAGNVSQAQARLEVKISQLDREIRERKEAEAQREKLISELQNAASEIKSLRGIIPICASCKKIRDDQGYWNQLETYLIEHSEAEFSHGLCPDCLKTFDPDA
ncbi:MAG: HAMP domain-containing protein [bacterium]